MIGDRYVIEFTDDTEPLAVTVADRTDVSIMDDAVITIYTPGRQTYIPWHRISAVTLEEKGKRL